MGKIKKYSGLIYGENLWGKFMGEIYGENLWGKFMGKIYGKNLWGAGGSLVVIISNC